LSLDRDTLCKSLCAPLEHLRYGTLDLTLGKGLVIFIVRRCDEIHEFLLLTTRDGEA